MFSSRQFEATFLAAPPGPSLFCQQAVLSILRSPFVVIGLPCHRMFFQFFCGRHRRGRDRRGHRHRRARTPRRRSTLGHRRRHRSRTPHHPAPRDRQCRSLLPDEPLPFVDQMEETAAAIQGFAERIPDAAARNAARILHASGLSANVDILSVEILNIGRACRCLYIPLQTHEPTPFGHKAEERTGNLWTMDLHLLSWHRRRRCYINPPGGTYPPIKRRQRARGFRRVIGGRLPTMRACRVFTPAAVSPASGFEISVL